MVAPRKPQASAGTKKLNRASKHAQADPAEATLFFGREICADFAAAEQREWLVTNGIGGFASGTIAGSATRRYHGLLFAALNPPAGRTLLVGGLDEIVHIGDQSFELATHRWVSGAVAPDGYRHIESLRLEGAIPVWTYRVGPARIEKRIWMHYGENTTLVRYTLLEPAPAVDLELKVLVNYRNFHSTTRAGDSANEWRMRINPVEQGVQVVAFDGAAPFYLKSPGAICEPQHIWYRDFFYPRERERGLDDYEDQLFAARLRSTLKKGRSLVMVLSTNPDAVLDADRALQQEQDRQAQILADGAALLRDPTQENASRSRLSQLFLAADQFVAARPLPGQAGGKTIIAGYHWFADWGRDTMIGLPGLALSTGRPEIAAKVLLAFSRFVDRGMLPNNFPDAGGAPEYNTFDATLWYFEAVRQYFAATGDLPALKKLFPVLADIIEAHLAGTRYNIYVDPADGLLYGGGPGAQLTWMDAKIGDWVVTPRTGKPVEINALWINALETMIGLAGALGKPSTDYAQRSARARSGFARFWNSQRNCCFDVLDAPGIGTDTKLRPNQIFAVSLGVSPLSPEQQKSVVDVCAVALLTPFGLRSLASGEPGYTGAYSGGPRERDAAYHQGTVWGWLLGPFALAHYRVYKDRAAALAFLKPLTSALDRYGVGTLGEIFDGDPPHHPRGCIAQAWTVAEVLRAWELLCAS
ncbi:MAG TPA: amylo-alpha-1,6-glucosidase [Candidatus Eisenbacteria bacterium]|nr:amylo-alpha-1,6-glucosidase [Candidatus Eisenbacteria bacterium]